MVEVNLPLLAPPTLSIYHGELYFTKELFVCLFIRSYHIFDCICVYEYDYCVSITGVSLLTIIVKVNKRSLDLSCDLSVNIKRLVTFQMKNKFLYIYNRAKCIGIIIY